MLVLDKDRKSFYQFKENGIALICTIGDGKKEWHSNIEDALKVEFDGGGNAMRRFGIQMIDHSVSSTGGNQLSSIFSKSATTLKYGVGKRKLKKFCKHNNTAQQQMKVTKYL